MVRWGSSGTGQRPALFKTKRVVLTAGTREILSRSTVHRLLQKHLHGDWGNCDSYDVAENELALIANLRIWSVFMVMIGDVPTTIWCITEADRSATTFLLPGEY